MAWTCPGGCSQLAFGRKKEMPWSKASKWPERDVQNEAVRPRSRPWTLALAEKKALRSAASASARAWLWVPAFVSWLIAAPAHPCAS